MARLNLPDKAYSISAGGGGGGGGSHLLVAATAGLHILLFDARKLTSASAGTARPPAAQIAARESSLKHQTRSVVVFNDGKGWATASVEGRVAVDFVADGTAGAEARYAFKAHRRKLTGEGAGEDVYPVNALAVHPVHGTLATGGGDGSVAVWDWGAKKRLASYSGYKEGITALAFSPDGGTLAIASSNDWSTGAPSGPTPGSLILRILSDAEVRPKAVAK